MQRQITKYLQLSDRKNYILAHTGSDWRPEYASELLAIEKELTELRQELDPESLKPAAGPGSPKVPVMLGLKQAAETTGLSYYFLRRLCLQGKIVYVNTGNRFLINMDKLTDYLNGEVLA